MKWPSDDLLLDVGATIFFSLAALCAVCVLTSFMSFPCVFWVLFLSDVSLLLCFSSSFHVVARDVLCARMARTLFVFLTAGGGEAGGSVVCTTHTHSRRGRKRTRIVVFLSCRCGSKSLSLKKERACEECRMKIATKREWMFTSVRIQVLLQL
jgi:hypothetical protein